MRIIRVEDISVSTELCSTVDREEVDTGGCQLVSVLVGEGAAAVGDQLQSCEILDVFVILGPRLRQR